MGTALPTMFFSFFFPWGICEEVAAFLGDSLGSGCFSWDSLCWLQFFGSPTPQPSSQYAKHGSRKSSYSGRTTAGPTTQSRDKVKSSPLFPRRVLAHQDSPRAEKRNTVLFGWMHFSAMQAMLNVHVFGPAQPQHVQGFQPPCCPESPFLLSLSTRIRKHPCLPVPGRCRQECPSAQLDAC